MSDSAKKVPCSVAIITRKGEGLREVLLRLNDFAEVVVCHANAPEEALNIARAMGARLVKQYDTDEIGVSSVMDKATVRERAMQASTYPWRFFMDRDDRLSQEAIEEIRTITTDSHPTHFVWRMPTYICIGGNTIDEARKIEHEATYPSYQTRLVHEKVNAHFKGEVHDRLVFDAKKFPVGTMKSFYEFHWPQERVDHFWRYQKTYVERELAVSEFPNFAHFLRWGVWYRVRIIVGYVLWRLPAMYVRWGFKDSMPLSLEIQIVGYHCLLLLGSIKKYITTRSWWIVSYELLHGATLSQAREAVVARSWEAYGKTLFVGTPHERARFLPYVKKTRWHKITQVNYEEFSAMNGSEKQFDTILICPR